ncbi:MAG TPA: CBS domain-containing protein [Desulfuromonadales bacterium]|nr:CBS domain-containing protein [Desulfuromonadales bacterium]
MKTVKTILQTKDQNLLSIAPTVTVLDAIRLMSEKNVGALPVMEGDKLVGIISERDYARKVILKGRSSDETLVKDIMTENVLTVTPENTNDECMNLMTEKCLRHLPVVSNKKVIGMISIADVVRAIMSDQNRTISNLESVVEDLQSDKNLRNLLFRELDKA